MAEFVEFEIYHKRGKKFAQFEIANLRLKLAFATHRNPSPNPKKTTSTQVTKTRICK